ncbi:hypothetical protein L1887_60349 [Cichorium endivia]|nr:hypothetical protein L1887_60349 [Cichorium endivia]
MAGAAAKLTCIIQPWADSINFVKFSPCKACKSSKLAVNSQGIRASRDDRPVTPQTRQHQLRSMHSAVGQSFLSAQERRPPGRHQLRTGFAQVSPAARSV